jgi:hypothetical protein
VTQPKGFMGETLSLAGNQVKSGKVAAGTDGTTCRSAAGQAPNCFLQ